jgi:hypothetical protein
LIELGILWKTLQTLYEISSSENVIFIDFKGVAVETVISNPKELLKNSMQFSTS